MRDRSYHALILNMNIEYALVHVHMCVCVQIISIANTCQHNHPADFPPGGLGMLVPGPLLIEIQPTQSHSTPPLGLHDPELPLSGSLLDPHSHCEWFPAVSHSPLWPALI